MRHLTVSDLNPGDFIVDGVGNMFKVNFINGLTFEFQIFHPIYITDTGEFIRDDSSNLNAFLIEGGFVKIKNIAGYVMLANNNIH